MNECFFVNYPETERISTWVFDFFCAELICARHTENHEMWLVCPWISDNSFDMSGRGPYEDLFPDSEGSQLSLLAVLKRFLDYGTKVHIICYPPHKLVYIRPIYDYCRTFRKLEELEQSLEHLTELHKQIPNESEPQKIANRDIEVQIKDIRDRIKWFTRAKVQTSLRQSSRLPVLRFLKDLKQYRSELVHYYYNERLHAKIILGKTGAFYGSANITQSGLNYNEELASFTNDPDKMQDLHRVIQNLVYQPKTFWKWPEERYSYTRALQRDIEEYKLKEILVSSLPSEMAESLSLLGITYTPPKKNSSYSSNHSIIKTPINENPPKDQNLSQVTPITQKGQMEEKMIPAPLELDGNLIAWAHQKSVISSCWECNKNKEVQEDQILALLKMNVPMRKISGQLGLDLQFIIKTIQRLIYTGESFELSEQELFEILARDSIIEIINKFKEKNSFKTAQVKTDFQHRYSYTDIHLALLYLLYKCKPWKNEDIIEI
jgi:hypothetical protein